MHDQDNARDSRRWNGRDLIARVEMDGRFLYSAPLAAPRTVLGREADAGMRLKDTEVSRQHAVFTRDAHGQVFLEDLQSKNGTVLNEHPIASPVPVRAGDVIRIGRFTIALSHAESAAHGNDPESTQTPTTPVQFVRDRPANVSSEQGEARLNSHHITLLSQLGQKLLATPLVMERMTAFCKLMTHELFRARAAVVLGMSGEQARLLCPVEAMGRWKTHPIYISRGVLQAVAAEGRPVLASNVGQQLDAVELSIAAPLIAMTVIACPLVPIDGELAVLYLILPPECASADWLALAALAAKQYQQADAAWSARQLAESRATVESELSQARILQTRLVPRQTQIAGMEYAIGFQPCRAIGGDYADVVTLPDGKILAVVADVCGKGLPAALIAFSIHTLVHSSARRGASLSQMTADLNEYLCDVLPDCRFVTLIAVMIDPAQGAMEFMNAGHPSGLVIGPAGGIRELESEENTPLGLLRQTFTTGKANLGMDEILMLYTDGLSELPTSAQELLGCEELAQRVAALAAADPAGGLNHLAAAIDDMLDRLQEDRPQQDDRTFLLARRLAS